MSKIHSNLTELIGHTPMLELNRISHKLHLQARLLAKLECFNPSGSVKDRIALAMIEQAEKDGILKAGGTIIEPTSGNTGIGLAWIARVKGYQVILTMPETMSVERRKLLKALGAQIILTPGKEGMKGSIQKAKELQEVIENAWIPSQFDNPANPAAHARSTALEIWNDTEGHIDVLVAGVGTGGTLCGTARALKAKNATLEVFAVEPATSAVLEGKPAGAHGLQGIGAGFIPENYDSTLIDGVLPVENEEAYTAARLLAQEEGLLAGISSGAALHAAISLAKQSEYQDKTIVVVLPDTGERYLSTPLYEA